MPKIKQITDRLLSKIISRKLLVFIISTVLVVIQKVDGQDWVMIAAIYIGSQAVIDAVTKYKNGGSISVDDSNEQEIPPNNED
ncbi:MAG: hypothetical protein ACPGRW_06095 [Flavobacteriaceae bacterium]